MSYAYHSIACDETLVEEGRVVINETMVQPTRTACCTIFLDSQCRVVQPPSIRTGEYRESRVQEVTKLFSRTNNAGNCPGS
jgi:hypothetical protein